MFADTVSLTGINGNTTLDTSSFTLGSAYSVGSGGAGGFTKIGSGVLNLTAGANYTGPTTVNNGTNLRRCHNRCDSYVKNGGGAA